MKDEYLEYIKNEKDIAIYKVSLLKKKGAREYRHRLISIEENFISYQFETMACESLDHLKVAMTLFRADRNAFNAKYVDAYSDKTRVITDGQIKTLRSKALYYNDMYLYLLDTKIKDPKARDSEASEVGLNEGAIASKNRARIQVLIYCLARFIHRRIKVIDARLEGSITPEEYDSIRFLVDNIFKDVDNEIYKHYNDGISEVPLITNGTPGHNDFIHTVYPLVNLLDKYPSNHSVGRILPAEASFFSKTGRPVKKRQAERGFGIVTSMPRLGNEAIMLLYYSLISESGTDLSELFCGEFFNVKIENDYYKAIPTIPVWSIKSGGINPFLLREVLGLLDLDGEAMADDIDFGNLEVTSRINNTENAKISLCGKSSKILIAATRSEAEHLRDAKECVDLLIKEIKNDYKAVFDLKNSEPKGRPQRLEGFANIANRGSHE